jgi:hypothetical protein
MNNDYQKWLSGQNCCSDYVKIEPCDKHKDVCDCDNILLEISKLQTNDEILQEEIDNLSGGCDIQLKTINGESISGTGNIEITCSGGSVTVDNELSLISTNPVENKVITEALNGKLDASAYTPVSLSGYATEQWVLDKHYITGVSLSDYYTKEESDARYSGSSVTVDSYLSTVSINPVQNKVITQALNNKLDTSAYTPTDLSNYYTKAQVDALISGLTQQIASLTSRLDICCGAPISPIGMRYTGTTSGGSEISLICCSDPEPGELCNELTCHDLPTSKGELGTLNVGECITVIGICLFENETNLSEAILPSTIVAMKDNVFYGCNSLTKITMLSETPPMLHATGGGTSTLFGKDVNDEPIVPNNVTIYVPASAVNTYKSATGWSVYSSIIQALP